MFTFYKMLADQNGWQSTLLKDNEVTEIRNDKRALQVLLSKTNYLVGYNNYNIDDKLLASVLSDIDPYESLKKIRSNKRFSLRLQNPISIDLKQELWNLELDEIKLNLGYGSKEDDLKTMQEIFKEREDYLTSKFEVVQEFRLPADRVKKTRVGLAADVLRSRKSTDKDRLNIKYDERLKTNELPKQILEFYKNIENEFKKGTDFKELEREKFTYKLAGLDHVFGFGGLHAAKENYVSSGNFMQIDVKSYYPTLILNNSFLDERAIDKYKQIYNTRLELQKQKDTKEEAYKLITNIVYGGLKSKWSNLYNPQMSNSIVVNGQLILTHSVLLLNNFCELIQSNTDGIIIKYEPVMRESIIKIIKLFEDRYNLQFDIDYITKIAQKDVNNYVIKYKDGTIHGIGRFANFDGGNFARNSYAIIDKALVKYYMNDVKVNRTIMNEYRKGNLQAFQYVVKSGKYDGMAQEIKQDTLFKDYKQSSLKKIDNVNRVFATRNKNLGSIYRVREQAETQYVKVPYTSEYCLVWNESLDKLNRRLIDLNWYIKETERWLF